LSSLARGRDAGGLRDIPARTQSESLFERALLASCARHSEKFKDQSPDAQRETLVNSRMRLDSTLCRFVQVSDLYFVQEPALKLRRCFVSSAGKRLSWFFRGQSIDRVYLSSLLDVTICRGIKCREAVWGKAFYS